MGRIVKCAICGRQIVSNSNESSKYLIGHDYGDGKCLMLVNGVVCPECTPSEIEFGELMENTGGE